jgi:anti-sigma factor ChrR (cupin superfamily)
MLNQNFHEKVVLQSDELSSVLSTCNGVIRTPLERNEDSEYAISTTIVDFEQNSFFDEHIHDSGEELFVLEGTFSDENGDYPAGTYLRNPDSSKHTPFSKKGCKLFVKLRQFHKSDNTRVVINTNKQEWLQGLVPGLAVMPLHNHEYENTALVKWDPNTEFNFHQHHGGEEIFVLNGTFYDEHGKYPKYTWIRSPHLSKHKPYTLEDGALIFVKTGHLLDRT